MNEPTIKAKFDLIVPVIIIFIGTAVISGVFGMLLFPAFTQLCVTELLYGVAKIGYVGVGIIFAGLMLEAYNLYEHHKKHILVLIILSIIMASTTAWLITLAARAYSC